MDNLRISFSPKATAKQRLLLALVISLGKTQERGRLRLCVPQHEGMLWGWNSGSTGWVIP